MKITRRHALLATSAAAGWSLIPGKVLGANGKVNLACVGVGHQGGGVTGAMASTGLANIVALCDVDIDSSSPVKGPGVKYGWARENSTPAARAARFPNARKFTDFRVMFDQMGNEIDAVMVGVPDHSHFPISMAAMMLGKHVYVEKPMARTFQECELMMRAEKKYGVVTQMGNQGHSGNNYFQFKAWKEAGIIKDVTHVDAYMNNGRRWHSWGDVQGFPAGETKPATLDWDVWLGTAQPHGFSERLHYGNWRGWYDFGTGCFGDWGAHILDTIHEFLELGLPSKISAKKLDGPNKFIYPTASTINFQFPERGGMPAMDIDWYDGVGNRPPVPVEFGDRKVSQPGKFIYSKETVFHGGNHGDPLQIIPYEKMRGLLEQGSLPRDFGKNSNHYANFLLACRGDEQPRSPFSVAGPLSQMFTLGCMAQRLGGKLDFDRKKKRITNNKHANSLLKDDVRKGWEQYYRI
ncbi:MAG: Gfo/Idh/MocA family oxidoreductase [Verrucomicrobiota bacterium]|nr:Gfo/Idh/MocA family oxidoreductase [Verrucomicrobiota bacterium]